MTVENRASIVLLAEEDGRSCLLTGDATATDIMAGMRALQTSRNEVGYSLCDVLKVQHHGSEFNVSKEFAHTVLADHYVFSADGAYANPDPLVVCRLVSGRAAVLPNRPFTLWFNCTAKRTSPTRAAPMQRALDMATLLADIVNAQGLGLMTVRVLRDDHDFFDICLCGSVAGCECVPATECTQVLSATS